MTRLLLLLSVGLTVTAAELAEAQAHPQVREGFWASFGFGYGSLGCEDCDGRTAGGAGYLRLGGTLSRRVLLGGEVTAWSRTENDATLSLAVIGPVLVFYPGASGGFYLKASLGAANLVLDAGRFSDDTQGGALVLGIGYDGRVGRKFSLTPFLDFVSGRFDGGDVNTVHFGLGFTFH